MAKTQQTQPGYAFRILGDTGLKRSGGFVREEFLAELSGPRGIRLYTEIANNHPIVGGFYNSLLTLVRGVKWEVDSASSNEEDVIAADLVSSCIDDMEQSWQDTLSEIMSFLLYGFSYHEICYKVRAGRKNPNRLARSRYNDGRIGWLSIAGRSQDSLLRWQFADDGAIEGMYQTGISGGKVKGSVFIPIDKALHFRARSLKNDPHGKSILRNAAVSYLTQRKLKEIESIGLERDLAGFPIARAPLATMSMDASSDARRAAEDMEGLAKKLKRDQSEGILLPSDRDANGGYLFDIQLITSGGTRSFNTSEIIRRYDQEIAMSLLADFLLIGHSDVGTYSLAENKTMMFARAIGNYLDIVCEEFSRRAIPQLLTLNGIDVVETPVLRHGDLEQRDLASLAAYVSSLAAAGMPLFPDARLEQALREAAGLPEPSADIGREVGSGSGDDVDDTEEQQEAQDPAQPALSEASDDPAPASSSSEASRSAAEEV